jgi:hypothetical protein
METETGKAPSMAMTMYDEAPPPQVPAGYYVALNITPQMMADQITTALEGGSNSWLRKFHARALTVTGGPTNDDPWYAQACHWHQGYLIEVEFDDPDHDEGSFDGRKELKYGDMARGLRLLAEKNPRQFANIITEDGDADTADALMQCIVLGDLVYG